MLIESAYFDPRLGAPHRAPARPLDRGLAPLRARRRPGDGAHRRGPGRRADRRAWPAARWRPGVLDSAPRAAGAARRSSSRSRRLSAFAGCEIPREFAVKVLAALELAPAGRRRHRHLHGPAATAWTSSCAEDLYEEVLRHFGYDNIPSALPAFAVEARASGSGPGRSPSAPATRWSAVGRRRGASPTAFVLGGARERRRPRSPLARPRRRRERGEPALGTPGGDAPLAARRPGRGRRRQPAARRRARAARRGGSGVLRPGRAGRRGGAPGPGPRRQRRARGTQRRAADFLDLKGVVEAVLAELGVETPRGGRRRRRSWRPARAPRSWPADRVVAVAGPPRRAGGRRRSTSPRRVWVAEVDLAAPRPPSAVPSFQPLPRFPAVDGGPHRAPRALALVRRAAGRRPRRRVGVARDRFAGRAVPGRGRRRRTRSRPRCAWSTVTPSARSPRTRSTPRTSRSWTRLPASLR